MSPSDIFRKYGYASEMPGSARISGFAYDMRLTSQGRYAAYHEAHPDDPRQWKPAPRSYERQLMDAEARLWSSITGREGPPDWKLLQAEDEDGADWIIPFCSPAKRKKRRPRRSASVMK